MHSKDLLSFLKDQDLFYIAKNHSSHFKNILKKSLKAEKNENVLIISDYGMPEHRVAPLMSGAYYLAANNLGLNVNVIMNGIKNPDEPADANVMSVLKSKNKPGIVIFNVSNKLGKIGDLGKNYRFYCKDRRHRFVSTFGAGSMVTNDFYSVTRSLDLNHIKLRSECSRLKKTLDWAREVVIKTSAGTDLKMNITGCKSISNDGNYDKPGLGGNVPYGEVYLPPKINTTEGKIVINCSSRNIYGTLLVKKPITLTFRKGMVTNIDGGYEAKILKSSIVWAEKKARNLFSIRRIGELGIGLNPRASVVGTMIVDEKVLGTAHIALGSNYWFGGDIFSLVHLDQVFKNPKIFIDGKEYKLPKKAEML